MTNQDEAGFGCLAFGHLASAFVDGELPRAEMDRFATHLPGCAACQQLCAQYRAIDLAASPAFPRPADADWDAAFTRVLQVIESDRAEAAQSPLGLVRRWVDSLVPRTSWARPLAAAAAAVALVALAVALREAWAPSSRPGGVTVASRATATAPALAEPAGGVRVQCQPGWEAVVWTLGGDDATTVVQCQPIET